MRLMSFQPARKCAVREEKVKEGKRLKDRDCSMSNSVKWMASWMKLSDVLMARSCARGAAKFKWRLSWSLEAIARERTIATNMRGLEYTYMNSLFPSLKVSGSRDLRFLSCCCCCTCPKNMLRLSRESEEAQVRTFELRKRSKIRMADSNVSMLSSYRMHF